MQRSTLSHSDTQRDSPSSATTVGLSRPAVGETLQHETLQQSNKRRWKSGERRRPRTLTMSRSPVATLWLSRSALTTGSPDQLSLSNLTTRAHWSRTRSLHRNLMSVLGGHSRAPFTHSGVAVSTLSPSNPRIPLCAICSQSSERDASWSNLQHTHSNERA